MSENQIMTFKGHYYTVAYSPDDGGYYAEIFRRDGKEVHSTEITVFEADAVSLAKIYINEYLGDPK